MLIQAFPLEEIRPKMTVITKKSPELYAVVKCQVWKTSTSTQEFGEKYDCKEILSHKKKIKCIALATTKAKNEDAGITKSLFVQLQGLIHFSVINRAGWCHKLIRSFCRAFFPRTRKTADC